MIMPLYQAKAYVGTAIESVLNQTYEDFEMLIIDDCPGDGTSEMVSQYHDSRIKILHNDRNRGIAYSRNRGFENSKGELIALLDHDDIALPCRFEKQVAFLENHPDIDVVGGSAQWIDAAGLPVSEPVPVLTDPGRLRAEILFQNIYWNCEVMFRRKIVDDGFRYQNGLLGMEDFKFWIDLSGRYRMSNIEDLVLRHRRTEQTVTSVVGQTKYREKKAVFEKLRTYSLQRSGYYLDKDDMEIINHILPEERNNWCRTEEEKQRFQGCLSRMIRIGRHNHIDYLPELILTCQRLSVEKTGTTIAE